MYVHSSALVSALDFIANNACNMIDVDVCKFFLIMSWLMGRVHIENENTPEYYSFLLAI